MSYMWTVSFPLVANDLPHISQVKFLFFFGASGVEGFVTAFDGVMYIQVPVWGWLQ